VIGKLMREAVWQVAARMIVDINQRGHTRFVGLWLVRPAHCS
jgi:hypothetical protein